MVHEFRGNEFEKGVALGFCIVISLVPRVIFSRKRSLEREGLVGFINGFIPDLESYLVVKKISSESFFERVIFYNQGQKAKTYNSPRASLK